MDEETRWTRAFQLNVQRKNFTPMEEARGLYERKKKFIYTDDELASKHAHERQWISKLIPLNTLPEKIQENIHGGNLGVYDAHQISRLAFDVSFPTSTGGIPAKEWVSKNPENRV